MIDPRPMKNEKLTAKWLSEGMELYARLCEAIEVDYDEMQARMRTALQLWLSAALQNGVLDLIAEAFTRREIMKTLHCDITLEEAKAIAKTEAATLERR